VGYDDRRDRGIEQMAAPDPRKDRRAPVSLKVRFKSATVDEFIEQYAKDISRGGIFIKSKKPMPVGTLLKFEFQLKDESRLIHGVGRVVWKREEFEAESSEHPPGMGIKFIKMDPASRTMVDKIALGRTEEGEFETGGAAAEKKPVVRTPTQPFFPPAKEQIELPAPEDRTQVRHASEFLASALSEADSSAADEAARRAEEARRRTEEIQRKREEDAARKRAEREAKERADREAAERARQEAARAEELARQEAQRRRLEEAKRAEEARAKAKAPAPAAAAEDDAFAAMAAKDQAAPAGKPADPLLADLEAELASMSEDAETTIQPRASYPSFRASAPEPQSTPTPEPASPFPAAPLGAGPSPQPAAYTPEPQPVAVRNDAVRNFDVKPVPSEPPPKKKRSIVLPAVLGAVAVVGIAYFAYALYNYQTNQPAEEADTQPTEPTTAEQPDETPEVPPETPPEQPPEPTVSVEVRSQPSGADITIDGRNVGRTPNAVPFPIGREVTLAVRLRGHHERSQQVTGAEGMEPISVELEPMPYVVRVETTPPGARVVAPGGRTTSPGEIVLRGSVSEPFKITAARAGYEVVEETVTPDRFEEQNGRMVLAMALTLPERARIGPQRPRDDVPVMEQAPTEMVETPVQTNPTEMTEMVEEAPPPPEDPPPPVEPPVMMNMRPEVEGVPDNPF
jgi:uncharacterized protein (TIGR02266 family)